MEFNIYNTLTRKREAFKSNKPNEVSIYTCGPTVYNYSHIGNLRTYIFEDVLIKSLEYNGYEVSHVMNITDVGHLQSDSDTGEDKMLQGARRENKSVTEIARHYEEVFFKDLEQLNIKLPDVRSRATEHIQEMIDLIKLLEAKDYTYIANGNVYFSIDKFPRYRELANLNLDELEAGSRIEIDVNKRNPFDFVLWFTNSKYENHILQWESPWGTGYPGWHIECSAMALKYLGEHIDIHCGGIDNLPVHHSNELAQSEAAIGHKWVNYWLHGEFLVLEGEKMSKSTGDFLTLSKLISDGFDPMDYRFFFLQSRYRKQLVFNYDRLKDARNAYRNMKKRIAEIVAMAKDGEELDSNNMDSYDRKFVEAINDDLNTPNAMTALLEVIKSQELNNSEKVLLIEKFDKVLSIDLLKEVVKSTDAVDVALVEQLIEERNVARANREWTLADEIRDRLQVLGVEILDTKSGAEWTVK